MIDKKFWLLVFALVVSGLSEPARAEVTLRFGVYTADKPTEVVRKFRPALSALESALSQRLGEPVKIKTKVARTYEDGVDDLVTGRVDFARFGPASYIKAKSANAAITVLAVESTKGRKVFNGIIAVHEDSPLRTVEDLRGRTFAFGNPSSTIGRYLSQLYLLRHGITAGDLAGYDYLDRHDKVGIALDLKQYDAGALKEGTFKKLVAKGRRIRALASFPNVTKPWIARAGLQDRLVAALRLALLDLRDPAALKALNKDGFLEGSDADYDVIREAMERSANFTG